jgi:recombination protein RecT
MSDQAKTDAGNVSQLPSRASFKTLGECRSLAEAFETKDMREKIAQAIPRNMSPDTMLRAFIQAATKAPLIFKCDYRQSIGAFLSLAYLGLEPGTVLQHAHLIPFAFKDRWNPKTRQKEDGYDLTLIIGYPGLVELAHRSGMVTDLQTGVVMLADQFEFQKGTDKYLIHRPNIDVFNAADTPRCAYAVASLIEHGKEFEVMPWGEVMSIRDKSQAFRRAKRAKEEAEEKGRRPPLTWTEAPWVAHVRQMARKTALRRLAGLLPKCPELRAGFGLDDANERGAKLDYGAVIEGTATPMDGIPERDETPPADPGATHGVRTNTAEDDGGGPPGGEEPPPPADEYSGETRTTTRAARTKPGPVKAGKPAPSAKPGASKPATTKTPPPPPPFETILINAYGEIGETYTDQVAFARAVIAMWLAYRPDEAAQLVEHNADALAEAEQLPAAAVLLKGLSEPHPGDDGGNETGTADSAEGEEPPENESDDSGSGDPSADGGEQMPWAAVIPPESNGKPAWSVWPTLVRDEMATIDAGDLDAWAGVQQAVIAEAPVQQRTIVARALAMQFAAHRLPVPDWLAALDPQAANDEKWLADREADLKAMKNDAAGRVAFDRLMRMDMVRTVMGRLERTAPTLFERAKKLFADKNAKLPRAAGEAP